MNPMEPSLSAVTLFVEDLQAARAFYERAFAASTVFDDAESAVFRFGSVLVNLLQVSAAPELIAPAKVAEPGGGVRMQLTVNVDDVDAACRVLAERGVELLNGPIARPWGIRTASFRDPAGHVWELASP